MRTNCNNSDPEVIESLFVEFDNPFGKYIGAGFLEVFNEILSNIRRGGKTCYVAGDYNLDIYTTMITLKLRNWSATYFRICYSRSLQNQHA